MAIEFLLVTYPEQRSVLADGAGVGFTNHILMLPGDEYEVTLDGGGYLPASHDIALGGTSLVKPLVIAFAPTAAAAASVARGAPPAVAAGALAPPAAKAKTPRRSTQAGARAETAAAVETALTAAVKPRAKAKKNA